MSQPRAEAQHCKAAKRPSPLARTSQLVITGSCGASCQSPSTTYLTYKESKHSTHAGKHRELGIGNGLSVQPHTELGHLGRCLFDVVGHRTW